MSSLFRWLPAFVLLVRRSPAVQDEHDRRGNRGEEERDEEPSPQALAAAAGVHSNAKCQQDIRGNENRQPCIARNIKIEHRDGHCRYRNAGGQVEKVQCINTEFAENLYNASGWFVLRIDLAAGR